MNLQESKTKAAPDIQKLAWPLQLGLLFYISNFTEHKPQTGPLWDHEEVIQTRSLYNFV